MALPVSELLVKKETIPRGSATLEEEEVMQSSSVSLVTWYSWGLFS